MTWLLIALGALALFAAFRVFDERNMRPTMYGHAKRWPIPQRVTYRVGDHVEAAVPVMNPSGKKYDDPHWQEGDLISIKTYSWGYMIEVGYWVGAMYWSHYFGADDVRVLPPRTPEEQAAWDRCHLPDMEGPAKRWSDAARQNALRAGAEWTESLTRTRLAR